MPATEQNPLYNAYKSRHFFGSLDGIRAISSIAVIWQHTTISIAWLPMSGRGFLGVDMFFILAGFLIVTLLLREKETTKTISLPRFYMRRFLRIFPIYYGVLFALIILFTLGAPNNPMGGLFFTSLPYYLTYTSNWLPADPFPLLALTWSLAAEEQFYIIWPLLEKWLQPFIQPILLGLFIINQLFNFKLIFPQFHGQLEILQITFTPIILGVWLAHLLANPKGFNWVARFAGNRYSSLIYAGILLLTLNLPMTDISGWPRLLIHLLMTTFLASCLVKEKHVLRPILTQSTLARIGIISYGIYLYHMFVRHVAALLLERLNIQFPLALFLITTMLTILAAELSFRYYEVPFLKVKKRWAAKTINLANAVKPNDSLRLTAHESSSSAHSG